MNNDYDPTPGYYTIRVTETGVIIAVTRTENDAFELAQSVPWAVNISIVNPKGYVIAD